MAANRVKIEIPKVIVKSTILSLVAAIIAAMIINQILIFIPISPEHTENEFIAINHGNPIVNTTQLMRNLRSTENEIDSLLVTPITLLIAGGVFCSLLPYATWPMKRAMKSALIIGVSMSILIILAGFGFTVLAQQIEGARESHINVKQLPIAGVQTLYNTVAFMIGAWIAAALRKKTPPPAQTTARKSAREQTA